MKLHSPVFDHNGTIPALFTSDGDNISPPLQWSDAPGGTQSFAIIAEDPDAPTGTITHWIIYNLPASLTGLDREVPEGMRYGGTALQGLNSHGKPGYMGPKPPDGEHRYVFQLYALDQMLPVPPGADRETLLTAMEDHVIEQAELIGLYRTHDDKLEVSGELRRDRGHEDAYDRAVHNGQADLDRDEGSEDALNDDLDQSAA